jgi:hypothetical protein
MANQLQQTDIIPPQIKMGAAMTFSPIEPNRPATPCVPLARRSTFDFGLLVTFDATTQKEDGFCTYQAHGECPGPPEIKLHVVG